MIPSFYLCVIFSTIISVEGAGLYQQCTKSEQCGTLDTFCNNGTCLCKENFIANIDTCVALPNPRISCKQKTECSAKLGPKSTCKNTQCLCKHFHHIYYNVTSKTEQCVKNRDLDETCDFDQQCYCGEDCDSNIGCIHGICDCKTGCKRYGRRCLCSKKSDVIKPTTEQIEETTISTSNETKLENQKNELFEKNLLQSEAAKICLLSRSVVVVLFIIQFL